SALRSVGALLERCRVDRLTRNQHVLFRLGELIAWAETAAVFAERLPAFRTKAIALPDDVLLAMSRVHAREAAMKVACDGVRWAVGAGQTDPDLPRALDIAGALAAQAGLLDD